MIMNFGDNRENPCFGAPMPFFVATSYSSYSYDKSTGTTPRTLLIPDARCGNGKEYIIKLIDEVMNRRPLLLLVYSYSLFAVGCSRHFRRLGWDVRMATLDDDIAELVRNLAPTAVVLDVEMPDRAAWSISARITEENPGLTVVLWETGEYVADDSAPSASQTTVRRGIAQLAQQLCGVAD